MAPESIKFNFYKYESETLFLTDEIFSEKTDVWAFGITLWEIMTRGCIPYPTIEPQKILTFIETEGKRMEKPDHAPAKVGLLLSGRHKLNCLSGI